MIKFEDFKKLEIQMGTVVSADKISGADRLIKVVANIGDKEIQVVAGFGHLISPEELIGKQVPLLVNIEPTEMMGVKSEGVFIALQDGDKAVLLLPEREVSNGAIVK